MSALQLEAQLGVTYKTAWLLTQKLRRSMIDPNREPLEGVVEVDQTEIPFRVGDAFFEPGYAGKILIAGAIEVIERDTNKPKRLKLVRACLNVWIADARPRSPRRHQMRGLKPRRQGQPRSPRRRMLSETQRANGPAPCPGFLAIPRTYSET
jgi:hypothetical protein